MKKTIIDRESWFLFTFTLRNIFEMLDRTSLNEVFGIWFTKTIYISNWIIVSMLLIQFIYFQKLYTKKELLIVSIVTIIIFSSTISSNSFGIVCSWLFIITARGINIDDCVKSMYKTIVIMTLFVFLLYVIGIAPDIIRIRKGGLIRHSWGFHHPNMLGECIAKLVLCHFFLKKDNITIREIILLLAAGVFIYKVPNSQGAIAVLFLTLVCFLLYHFIDNRKKAVWSIISIIMNIIALFANLVSVYYGIKGVQNGTFIKIINGFISNRLSDIHTTYQYFGLKWFGQYIPYASEGWKLYGIYLSSDNAFMILALRYGIIVYLMFTLAYTFYMNNARKEGDFLTVIIYFIYSLYGLAENNVFLIFSNIWLLEINKIIYQKDFSYTFDYRPRGLNEKRSIKKI